MSTMTPDKDASYELCSSFEEDQPSEALTRQTMSRILIHWSLKPNQSTSLFCKDYFWFFIGGAAIVFLLALFPSQLGIDSDFSADRLSNLTASVFASVEQMGRLIHPLVWIALLGGALLVLLDNLIGKVKKV